MVVLVSLVTCIRIRLLPRRIYSGGADLFASFFGSVYTPASAGASALNTELTSDCRENMHQLDISISEIYSKLNSLDESKGPGFDGIPPLFLEKNV